jgi:DNA-binding winged helix-turn-helix (wHTH) protein
MGWFNKKVDVEVVRELEQHIAQLRDVLRKSDDEFTKLDRALTNITAERDRLKSQLIAVTAPKSASVAKATTAKKAAPVKKAAVKKTAKEKK